MTAACTVSGCGSTAAYLDTTTVRTAQWVQIRGAGQREDAARWFCTTLCMARTTTNSEIGQTDAQLRSELAEMHEALTDADGTDRARHSHIVWLEGQLASAMASRPEIEAAAPGPCTTDGCGTPADDVDGSDPALWGWICLYVGGSESAMRWVCSPWCATAAITAGGAELAKTDQREAVAEPASGGGDR